MVEECPPHGSIVATQEDPDWPILMKWLRSGIIDGDCGTGEKGDVFLGPALTDSGRALLSSLEEQTSIGLIKKGRFGFYKWFFSSLGGAVIGYITRFLTE
jgi:hypothetical protein